MVRADGIEWRDETVADLPVAPRRGRLRGTGPPSGTPASYTNPVLDADFPDPSVIRAPDHFYYAYATQTQRGGKWVNIQVARSTDLVHWQHLGDALPAKPGWATATQDFWAPDVIRDGSRYIMYFSAKPNGTDERHGLCLGIATASSPAGPFTDIGRPLKCGQGFVNIDPMAFDDPATGKRLLYWGSGFKPIKVQELGARPMSFAEGSAPTTSSRRTGQGRLPGARRGRMGDAARRFLLSLLFGRQLLRRQGQLRGDGRAVEKRDGPFETLEQATGKPHSIILEKRGYWIAPGHNSVITDSRRQRLDRLSCRQFRAVRARRRATRSTPAG